MSDKKFMVIRGARIEQQMEREGLLDEASTYQDLERRTIAGFPNTTKRQHVVQPLQVTRTEFVPFVPTGNLRCDATVVSNNPEQPTPGPITYYPQIMFSGIEFQDENTPENVTLKTTSNKDVNVVPISLSDNTVKVRCTCLDFYHRFAEYNFGDDSLYGKKPPPYQRKTTTRPDANPTKTPGVCKHVMKTILALRDAGLIKR